MTEKGALMMSQPRTPPLDAMADGWLGERRAVLLQDPPAGEIQGTGVPLHPRLSLHRPGTEHEANHAVHRGVEF